jgi:hypothetical protein
METFVGCKIIINKANDTVYIHQPKLLLHLKQEFGALVESFKELKTPARPRIMVKRPDKEDVLITVEQQRTFLSHYFVVKDLGEMETFVGCKIINNKANDTIYIHQPKLLLHLKQDFGALVESLKEFKTPAPPRSMVKRPDKEYILITIEQQTNFRSGVGMLLYLVKHSRFDIANSVREISKVADGATIAHWKLLLRCIKYVITTEYLALKLNPNTKESNFDIEGTTDGADLTEVEGISNSEYRAEWNLYFCGALIAWKSKASNSVTLSST